MSARKFLTLEQVAEQLAVEYQLVYRLVRSGSLPAMKVGRIYRVDEKHLEAFIERQTSGSDLGFRCGSCGKHFNSLLSQRGRCPKTDLPICADCWSRKGVRSCAESKTSRDSSSL